MTEQITIKGKVNKGVPAGYHNIASKDPALEKLKGSIVTVQIIAVESVGDTQKTGDKPVGK